jgi:hypothetical protein
MKPWRIIRRRAIVRAGRNGWLSSWEGDERVWNIYREDGLQTEAKAWRVKKRETAKETKKRKGEENTPLRAGGWEKERERWSEGGVIWRGGRRQA